MNNVYILNKANSNFSSIVMNILTNKGLYFTNLETTTRINHRGSTLIYVLPKDCDYDTIHHTLFNTKYGIMFFNKVLIVCSSYNDYIMHKSITDLISKNRFKFIYYQTIALDTRLADILTDDCISLSNVA